VKFMGQSLAHRGIVLPLLGFPGYLVLVLTLKAAPLDRG
jgi:hypothetical protein